MASANLDHIKDMLDEGDLQGARLELLNLVEQGQETEGIWLLLAGIGMRTGDAVLSLRAYRSLERTRPLDPYVASGIVESLMRLEQYEEARDVIEVFARTTRSQSDFTRAVLDHNQEVLEIIEEKLGRR
ncbi:hypothetical protein [Stenotrophomonas sp.]|uniref:hypothetical protein n=1 Tax=Stenotrophomonas sp. TaxID=69392 RepID=UPI0028AA4451|nr:hypothetical protein [Stenotrophomonas sp.]